jgi:asparagine synthase (glutamine-hydrolysing)
MCGLAGEIRLDGGTATRGGVQAMIDTIVHRGPDGEGVHHDGPVALGHRRLSIVDLATGDQPLATANGAVWCVFNGEIYDHRRTRAQLESLGHEFLTASDTEVIVHLYEEYGLDFVDHLTGMFAIALWDVPRQRLVLARDRVGIKPLYYAHCSDTLFFASEIKALQVRPEVSREFNPAGIDRFLTQYYMPGTDTLLENVHKLAPGSVLVVEDGTVEVSRYWRLEVGRRVRERPLAVAAGELEELLDQVVEDHLLADVPLGFLLSGGLDSSLVVALASRHLDHRARTFTVGFESPDVVDERPFARTVAEKFDCEHHEISLRPEDFWEFLPTYVRHMEEPVCEAPAIALAAVAELAARHVKVVLSGEGGDEAFAGYVSYRQQLRLEQVSRLVGPIGRFVGPTAARVLERLGRPRGAPFVHSLGTRLEDRYRSRTASPYQYAARHRAELYGPALRHAASDEYAFEATQDSLAFADGASTLSRMLQVDTETWLPDDLLVKADKMTMLHSLELRVPLLDHRVLEWAARLPDSLKLDGGAAKRVLQEVARKVLPAMIVERPKAGFPVPYERWLRTTLAADVDELLLGPEAEMPRHLDADAMRSLIRADRRELRYGKEVFALVVLELWYRNFITGSAGSRG